MATEINTLFPGVVGDGDGQIPLSSVDSAGGTVSLVGLVGLVAVVYSGLGWLSGMRLALEAMFAGPISGASMSESRIFCCWFVSSRQVSVSPSCTPTTRQRWGAATEDGGEDRPVLTG
jgi:hypothetical protein